MKHGLYRILTIGAPGAIVYFLASKWPPGANAILAGVTAVYAALVYLQLREMEKQRSFQREQHQQQARLEYDQRPIVAIGPYSMTPPYFRRSSEMIPVGSEVGQIPPSFGYYINVPLQNVGRTIARRCQPLLTGWAVHSDGTWRREANWLPIGLLWALDEPTFEASDHPTGERDLVPGRPYLFNLGRVSLSRPEHFTVLLVMTAFSQPNTLPRGDYCFEVSAYSENAAVAMSWFRVKWEGRLTRETTDEDARRMMSVEALGSCPW
jgi:hypothetical protein